ncbi:MAG: phosphoribosylaminoimidazolesuccinocarboxamide synthase, partial [bacterium]|nr:phosphoribosylaminoimidazolesuccinocarboxamide synthase [bacterium]
NKIIAMNEILENNGLEKINEMEEILRKAFLTLEGTWNTLGFRIIDMKIEFGISSNGELMIADVIDNDSWRLKSADWEELSKEAFRQGEELNEVEKKYAFVASLTKKFRIPKQAVVFWRGSDSDPLPDMEILEKTNGVDIEIITESGHKSTGKCLKILENILSKYPDGGVIITKVGRSNGLGPILAARTSWPTITIPATLNEFPEDVWSSIRMPSSVPLATVWPESNAVLFVLEILAQKNPILYQKRQMMIEGLDE